MIGLRPRIARTWQSRGRFLMGTAGCNRQFQRQPRSRTETITGRVVTVDSRRMKQVELRRLASFKRSARGPTELGVVPVKIGDYDTYTRTFHRPGEIPRPPATSWMMNCSIARLGLVCRDGKGSRLMLNVTKRFLSRYFALHQYSPHACRAVRTQPRRVT